MFARIRKIQTERYANRPYGMRGDHAAAADGLLILAGMGVVACIIMAFIPSSKEALPAIAALTGLAAFARVAITSGGYLNWAAGVMGRISFMLGLPFSITALAIMAYTEMGNISVPAIIAGACVIAGSVLSYSHEHGPECASFYQSDSAKHWWMVEHAKR